MNRNTKIAIAAAGLAVGLLIGFVLPSGWLFVADAKTKHAGHAGHAGDGTKYACPMFCTIMDEMPADGRCPVCGMDLTPVSGKNTLNEHERMMTGLAVEAIRRVPLSRSVRVVGEVDYDETRLARITTRMPGWLERVWADTTWAAVRKGDKLASIYSPELYAAQKEYLVALGDDGLLHAAERRLKLLGIGDDEIATLRRDKKVQDALVLRAPLDGVIIERRAVEGASVKTGDLLYAVADLSRVWVQAEVFENDLVWMFEQQPVRLRMPAAIEGRVAFIDPVIDRTTRTARIRIEVDNAAGALRIGQRVDAWVDARVNEAGEPVPPDRAIETHPLAVPRTAVLSTGRREVVYVLFTESTGRRDYKPDPKDLPETVLYQLVPVRLGPVASSGGTEFRPVLGVDLSPEERKELQLDGLTEGMFVVTRGNLLLDSQAQLSGKPSLLFPEGSRGSADPHAGH